MYYKVLDNNKVVDVLNSVVYARYNDKGKLRLCLSNQAQVIISSDETEVWHIRGLYSVPGLDLKVYDLVEIDEREYKQLKALNGKTPEEIIDEYTLLLIEEGII